MLSLLLEKTIDFGSISIQEVFSIYKNTIQIVVTTFFTVESFVLLITMKNNIIENNNIISQDISIQSFII